jgi:hypothetical protein
MIKSHIEKLDTCPLQALRNDAQHVSVGEAARRLHDTLLFLLFILRIACNSRALLCVG